MAKKIENHKVTLVHWLVLIAAYIADIYLLFTMPAKGLSGQSLVIYIMLALFVLGVTIALISILISKIKKNS